MRLKWKEMLKMETLDKKIRGIGVGGGIGRIKGPGQEQRMLGKIRAYVPLPSQLPPP